jgi:hypothetical protein
MKKLFLANLLLAVLMPVRAQSQQSSGTLAAFLQTGSCRRKAGAALRQSSVRSGLD